MLGVALGLEKALKMVQVTVHLLGREMASNLEKGLAS
jgi:hypothetical protein